MVKLSNISEVLIVSFLGLIGQKVVGGLAGLIMIITTFIYLAFQFYSDYLFYKKDKREAKKRAEEHEKHIMEIEILKSKLKELEAKE